jgi:hypothetical protein
MFDTFINAPQNSLLDPLEYVELRKVGTWGSLPTSSIKGGKKGVLQVPGLD